MRLSIHHVKDVTIKWRSAIDAEGDTYYIGKIKIEGDDDIELTLFSDKKIPMVVELS